MTEQIKNKIVAIIESLKITTDELREYERQESKPFKELPYSQIVVRDIKAMILGRNIVDLNAAVSKIFEAIHSLENIQCREVTK